MKSHERVLLEVAICILKDTYSKCTAVKFDPRDVKTLTSRLEHEGLSFLTISLPSLGSDLEKGLSLGRLEPTLFRAFRKRGRIPAFMQGIFARVFEQTTGVLHDEPCISAIEGIRQVAYVFKKLKVDCHPKRVQSALDGYMQCEHDLESPIEPDDITKFRSVSSCLWGRVIRYNILDDALPKHGPGATRERISGNAKYVHERWHERLEQYFPFLETAYSVRAATSKEFERVSFVSADDEQPVRVITVPKTLKGPRIIAIEPVCMQYTQQLVSSALVKTLESHWLTRGHVNFTDQSINQRHALESSKSGVYATLDLSSASDRVPHLLALDMFSTVPHIRDAIDACRTTTAELPNGDIVRLKKFASMGSALCFPVESMYFYTICILSLLEHRGLPVTTRNVYNVSRSVFVYGDDIIVPTDAAVVVMDNLAKFKCKVNVAKSFWNGKFRESCGTDAYDGEEVTPTYVRHLAPHHKRSSDALISWVAASNHMFLRGYWQTASYMQKHVEATIGALPVVGRKCSGLGVVSFMGYRGKIRGRYQRPEVRTWVPSVVRRNDELTGYGALMKCLLSLESRVSAEPSSDSKHLHQTARHGVATLKLRWVSVA